MFKGMIFDMDGVIVDSHPAHLRAWQRLFCSLGKPLTDEDLDFILDGHRREEILRHYLGDISEDKLQKYGFAKDELFREEASRLRPIPGVLRFIEKLKEAGVQKAIATAARRDRARLVLTKLGIADHFTTVVTSDDLAEDKPHPHIFLLASRRLAIDPADLVVAEDAVSGIKAGKAAGMRCLAVTPNGRAHLLVNAGADKVIPDFRFISVADVHALFVSS
jgi:beta-phosphoglucomutase